MANIHLCTRRPNHGLPHLCSASFDAVLLGVADAGLAAEPLLSSFTAPPNEKLAGPQHRLKLAGASNDAVAPPPNVNMVAGCESDEAGVLAVAAVFAAPNTLGGCEAALDWVRSRRRWEPYLQSETATL
jgi:hypothetical protein